MGHIFNEFKKCLMRKNTPITLKLCQMCFIGFCFAVKSIYFKYNFPIRVFTFILLYFIWAGYFTGYYPFLTWQAG